MSIILLNTPIAWAEKCSNDPVATINVALDYSEARQKDSEGNWVVANRLDGVMNDRITMNQLSKKLFKSDQQFEFTDKDIAIDNQYIENTRDLFLDKIKKYSKNFKKSNGEKSKIYLNISTHGIRCKKSNGEIQWGIIIPPKKLILSTSSPSKDDPEYLFNCEDETFKKMFVSANDIVNEISPDGIIIDTCYSGEFEKNIISTNLNYLKKDGLFIFTSALNNMMSEEVTAENKQQSGVLFESLNRIIDSPQICSLDINQDGELSQEEIGFYFLSVYTTLAQDELPINKLLSEYNQLEKKKQTHKDLNYNLGTAKVNDKCFYKIPEVANCPNKPNLSSQQMTCSDKLNIIEDATDRLKSLFNNKSLTFVNRENNRRNETSVIQKNLIELSSQSVSPNNSVEKNLLNQKKENFYIDHRRAEAINFFGDYIRQHTAEAEQTCGLNPKDSHCHPNIKSMENLKNQLYQILTIYKEM